MPKTGRICGRETRGRKYAILEHPFIKTFQYESIREQATRKKKAVQWINNVPPTPLTKLKSTDTKTARANHSPTLSKLNERKNGLR